MHTDLVTNIWISIYYIVRVTGSRKDDDILIDSTWTKLLFKRKNQFYNRATYF